jgi:hypothetical protein
VRFSVHVLQVLLYFCSISFYNFFGLSVTNEFSSVHRTLIDASRTVFVWAINLLIYYKIDSCVVSFVFHPDLAPLK